MPGEEDVKKEEASKEEEKPKEELSAAQVKQALTYLVQQNQTLATELQNVKGQVMQRPAEKTEAPAPTDDQVDVEVLSNKQLVNHIFKKIEQAYVKPAADQIAHTEASVKSKEIRDELKEVASKYPEFWEFRNEVKGVLEEYPEMKIADAFAVAKTRAPDTVRRLEEVKEKERMDKEKTAAEKKKAEFGGLLPTSGKTSKSSRMAAKDAAEAAWEDLEMDDHMAAISTQ